MSANAHRSSSPRDLPQSEGTGDSQDIRQSITTQQTETTQRTQGTGLTDKMVPQIRQDSFQPTSEGRFNSLLSQAVDDVKARLEELDDMAKRGAEAWQAPGTAPS